MSADVSRRVGTAATLLAAAARADTNPGTRVLCLLAVHHLRAAGAEASGHPEAEPGDVERVIRRALRTLAGLPSDVFARADILAGAAAARAALTRAQAA